MGEEIKKSGAKYTRFETKEKKTGTIVNAWNVSKSRGMVTAKVAPYHKSKIIPTNSKGNSYQTMMAEVNFHRTGINRLIPCLMNIETMVINLPEIGMCITPNGKGYTKSGKKVTGYFGINYELKKK